MASGGLSAASLSTEVSINPGTPSVVPSDQDKDKVSTGAIQKIAKDLAASTSNISKGELESSKDSKVGSPSQDAGEGNSKESDSDSKGKRKNSTVFTVGRSHPCGHDICKRRARNGFCLVADPDKERGYDATLIDMAKNVWKWSKDAGDEGLVKRVARLSKTIVVLVATNLLTAILLATAVVALVTAGYTLGKKVPEDIAVVQAAYHKVAAEIQECDRKHNADQSELISLRIEKEKALRSTQVATTNLEKLRVNWQGVSRRVTALMGDLSESRAKNDELSKSLHDCNIILAVTNMKDRWTDFLKHDTLWWHYVVLCVAIVFWTLVVHGISLEALIHGCTHMVALGRVADNPWTFYFGVWSGLIGTSVWVWVAGVTGFLLMLGLRVYQHAYLRIGVMIVMSVGFNVLDWFVSDWFILKDMTCPWMAGLMYTAMGVMPLIMRLSLWSQGAVVRTTSWDGVTTVQHVQNSVQKWWWTTVMQMQSDPAPLARTKAGGSGSSATKPKKKVSFVQGETFFPDRRNEANVGGPFVSKDNLEAGVPWDVLNMGSNWCGTGFVYKGVLITPKHVWEAAGQNQHLTFVSPDGREFVCEKVGELHTSGEICVCFRAPPGYKSIKVTNQKGTVVSWARVHNGTVDRGITWGVVNTVKNTHDLSTMPGDSGTPLLDCDGKLVGIHVAAAPGVNISVRPVTSEAVIVLEGCACDEDCCCELAPRGGGIGGSAPAKKIRPEQFLPVKDDHQEKEGGKEEQEGKSGKAWKRNIRSKNPKGQRKNPARGRQFTDEEYDELVNSGKSAQQIREIARARALHVFGIDDTYDDGQYEESLPDDPEYGMHPCLFYDGKLDAEFDWVVITHDSYMYKVFCPTKTERGEPYKNILKACLNTSFTQFAEFCSAAKLVFTRHVIPKSASDGEEAEAKNSRGPGQRRQGNGAKKSWASKSRNTPRNTEKENLDFQLTPETRQALSMFLERHGTGQKDQGNSPSQNQPAPGTSTSQQSG